MRAGGSASARCRPGSTSSPSRASATPRPWRAWRFWRGSSRGSTSSSSRKRFRSSRCALDLAAARRAALREEAGITAHQLTQPELKLIPGLAEPDPMRAVATLPGVVSSSDVTSSFNVRGASADQNLILLDGIPVFSPQHLGGVFSIFNTDIIDRAELYSGGFPPEFGGRVSSVLSIESDVGDGDFGVS